MDPLQAAQPGLPTWGTSCTHTTAICSGQTLSAHDSPTGGRLPCYAHRDGSGEDVSGASQSTDLTDPHLAGAAHELQEHADSCYVAANLI